MRSVFYKASKLKLYLPKIEMSNEWNVNFIQKVVLPISLVTELAISIYLSIYLVAARDINSWGCCFRKYIKIIVILYNSDTEKYSVYTSSIYILIINSSIRYFLQI